MGLRSTHSLLLALAAIVPGCSAQRLAVIPSGTPLWIKSGRDVRLRLGASVRGTLMYATFAANRELLPAGTVAVGTVDGLIPNHSQRLQSRLRGDFTPFDTPVIRFQALILPNGARLPIAVGDAQDGAPVLQLTPPPPRHGGFIRREFDMGLDMAKDRLHTLTAPGKEDRLKKLLYSQLPYHPQTIASGTVWTVETTAPIALPPALSSHLDQPPQLSRVDSGDNAAPKTYTLHAYLAETLSSASAKAGDPIRAIVAQPVLDAGTGEVEVPQGAVLEGSITRARPARRFGRAGELRFDLRELSLPGESAKPVQTTLSALDATGDSNLSLDREGQVQPKPKDKVVVPFILLTLAGRPLDRDRGDDAFGKDAVASNSLGVVGFIVGTAAGWRNVAAGIGYYGSAIAIWNRWIKRGDETTLRRDTRLVVQTTARRSAPLPSGGGKG